MTILTFNNVNKTLYNFKLKDINFSMNESEILGIVGRSGAGKTTIAKLLLNFYRPSKGNITVFEKDSVSESKSIKYLVGTIPQSNWFTDHKRPMGILKESMNYRRLRNKDELNYLIDYFELKVKGDVGSLPQLEKRKLAIINALVTKPSLIVVDEPNAITDPKTKMKLYDILEEKNREGVSVLILTSNLKEAQSICNRIIYVDNGEIIEEEDQSNKLSNDKILKYYDKNVDENIFVDVGAHLVRTGAETVFYYNSNLSLLSEAIYRAGLIDYSLEDSTLEDKLAILEKRESLREVTGVEHTISGVQE